MKIGRDALSRLVPSLRSPAVSLRMALASLAGLLLCMNVVELARSSDPPKDQGAVAAGRGESATTRPADPAAALAILQQKNLFEPAVPLPSRRVAKQSVDRIMGMLSLNAIMQSGDDYVAYIQVKGYGLKRFRAGEGVQEMFRVTRIEPRRVELDVVGERMKLEL